jgi:cytochrome c oxidase subunit 4
MSQHIASVRSNLVVFALLMVLLVATVAGAYMPLGRFHLAVAMTIALAKALLVLLYFMHVRYSTRVTWAFSAAAFVWLAIMVSLTLSDYLTRGTLLIEGK